MIDASETSILGSRPLRDRESSTGHMVWPQLLLSAISDSTYKPHESALEDGICSNGEDSDCDGTAEGGNKGTGYGSIGSSENFRQKELSPQRESDLQPLLFPDNDDLLPAISGGSDRTDVEMIDRRRNCSNLARQQQQRRSLVAWMVLVVLSCSCLTYFVPAIQGNINNRNRNAPGIPRFFIFDTLFSGVKKKTPRASLERPPPLARSILLVLRAQVTPENAIVPDMDRQLTASGMQEAEGLGIYLAEHRIPPPDWIFVSPSERTAYTTELVRRHWGANAPVAFEDILYTLEFNDYFSFVKGLNDQFRRVMIVGHNPAILNTAKKLMKTHGIEDFPDCGLMELRWNDLNHWNEIAPSSGSSTMAIDPNNNFFFSSPP